MRKRQSYGFIIILLAWWMIIHYFLFNHFGIRSLWDGEVYVNAADYLVKNGKLEDIHLIFYSIPIGVMAFFRFLFSNQILPFLFFQCLLSGFSMVALFYASARIFKSQLAGFFSSFFFLLWLDNIQWNITTMTESLFCSLTIFTVFILSTYKSSKQNHLLLSLFVILLFFTRPTSVVIMVGLLAFFLVYYSEFLSQRKYRKIGAFVLAGGVVILGANLMLLHWDFTEQYIKGNIVTYMDSTQGSSLYYPELRLADVHLELPRADQSPLFKMVYFMIHNPVYFLKAAGLKVWYLLTFLRPYYSVTHNVYSLIWMAFMYSMVYIGWKKLTNQPIKYFVLTVIVANCTLIAISSVDWNNRFYIPMEPGIVLLAGGGAAYAVKRLSNRFTSQHNPPTPNTQH